MELGSGLGTSYPTALDIDDTLEVNAPNVGKTKARAEAFNDLAAAILAIETELGTSPSGTSTNVKTFLQTEHNTNGTHKSITTDTISASGQIISTLANGTPPLVVTSTTMVENLYTDKSDSLTDGTNIFRFKKIDIGDWNMDSTTAISVAHGLTYDNIIGCKIVIKTDDLVNKSNINFEVGGYTTTIAGNIILYRTPGGTFDSSNFSSTSYNRGYIFIIYVD